MNIYTLCTPQGKMVLHNGHMLNSVGVIHSRITTFPRPFSAASHSVNTADITKTW